MSKKNLASKAASIAGLTNLLEALANRDSLLVLNYHRIGDRDTTEFDRGVYSATPEEFERQVTYIQSRFEIITLEEVTEKVTSGKPFGGPKILLTFDDGYIDNYELAFPILRSLGAQATFFLVSDYLQAPTVPWWDKIAYLIRNAHPRGRTLRLHYPTETSFHLTRTNREQVIRSVLNLYKLEATKDTDLFLAQLEEACQIGHPFPSNTRMFLTSDQAKEMIQGGMAIGGHTRTHRILGKLTPEEQKAEVEHSVEELTRELGIRIDSFSYPVGSQVAFNDASKRALQEHNFQTAFSFYGGLNKAGSIDPLDIRRFGVESNAPFHRFQLQVAGTFASNGYWF